MRDKIAQWGQRGRELWLGLCFSLTALTVFLTAAEAWASGGKPATKLINVADTRALTGFTRWAADVYNSNLWLYGLMVVLIMAGMGLVLGLGFDRLISLLGIDLGKLDHHE